MVNREQDCCLRMPTDDENTAKKNWMSNFVLMTRLPTWVPTVGSKVCRSSEAWGAEFDKSPPAWLPAKTISGASHGITYQLLSCLFQIDHLLQHGPEPA